MDKNIERAIELLTEDENIASFPQILGKLVKEKYYKSLLWQICDIFPLKSTLGRIYITQKKMVTDNRFTFEVKRKDISPELHKISTSITKEVIQDIQNMYGEAAYDILSDMFKGVSDYQENHQLMEILDQKSLEKNELVLGFPENDIERITERIGRSVLEINQYSFETSEGWCILPRSFASSFFGYQYGFKMDPSKENQILHLGKYGHIDYYLDPREPIVVDGQFDDSFSNDYALGDLGSYEYVYVGLRDKKMPGYGSLVFAPYQYQITEAINPLTGNPTYFMWNRYGVEISPFHDPTKNRYMLHKFKISRA